MRFVARTISGKELLGLWMAFPLLIFFITYLSGDDLTFSQKKVGVIKIVLFHADRKGENA